MWTMGDVLNHRNKVRIDSPKTWHEDVNEDTIIGHLQADDNIGLCLNCGEEAYGVEPDAKGYHCEGCETDNVYGVQDLLFRIDI